MSTLIKNGRIITAEQDYLADIYIENEQITTIGKNLAIEADTVIDAKNKYVIPGGIDAHTHLDMPFGGTTSCDDFENGTRAAAFGGTTSIVDFAIQTKGSKMREALDTWWAKAEGRATTDYGLHMIITDLPDADIEDMSDMVNEGVTSFKLFMAYPGVLMVDDATIFKALRHTAKTGALVCMHAENGNVIDLLVQQALAEGKTAPIYHALTRPTTAEAEAVNRSIALAEMAGAPIYIVHLSSNDALEKVAEARDKGLPAYAETCPQYLFLSIEEDMNKPGFEDAKVVFTPPLREKWHQDKLWAGLKKNTLQIVSTDHCPFCFKEQKELGIGDFTKIPNGGPGIEHRLQLLFSGVNEGRISLNRWVELCSTNPAKMFGMYPKKGAIVPGADADIVIWDPQKEHTISVHTHHMCADYSMFEGKKIKGNADTVLSRGEIIVKNNEFFGKPGRGKFIKRDAYGTAWQ